jgi:tRNA G46 methylase TrmB
VLRLARQRPDSLIIGVDTNAAALVEASRKAARKLPLPNALFIIADATDALAALHGRVDQVRITLPWGSLLRRMLEGERAFALAVAGSLCPGGTIEVLVSVTDRDAPARIARELVGAEALGAFAAALREQGLDVNCREAKAKDVAEVGSTWAKRLGIPHRRPGWVLRARKC